MINLFRAEWQKIAGHRWLTGLTLWVFPIGAVGILLLATVVGLLIPDNRAMEFGASFGLLDGKWTDFALAAWFWATSPVATLLLLGFTATLFAGEFQWQTWKNIVPRSTRVRLILMKYFTLGVFVVFAFTSMSVILAVGAFVPVSVIGGTYGPPLSGEVLSSFAGEYLLQAALTFTKVIITAGYAAVAALITRSIFGSVIAAFLITLGETGVLLLLLLISQIIDNNAVLMIYQFLPTYNMGNVLSWVNNGAGQYAMSGPGGMGIGEPFSMGASIMLLALWVVLLVGTTAFIFQRRDLTS